ncbi:MAG: hypothetical protein IJ037_12865 [Clostridia bacterium]|nr:hypothetical protein [Clostridia bacterium]
MKNRVLAAILTSLLLAFSVASCGSSRYSEDEIRGALEELLPKSHALNVIYFGEGLPLADDNALVEEFYGMFDSDIEAINYHPVDPDCGYANETEIREATLEVFTADYAEYLFERAFSGISATFNEGGEEAYTTTAVYAMYLEQDGILTARINLAEEAIPLGREYDLAGMKILDEAENTVTVEIPTTMDGRALDVELRLVKTDAGWRLDSPTY